MFYALLVSSIVWALYKLVIKSNSNYYKDAISHYDTAEDCVELRKEAIAKRKRIVAVYFSLVAVALVVLSILMPPYILANIFAAGVLCLTVLTEKNDMDIYGNISLQTAEDFLKENNRYYLYLRGFNDDHPFGEEVGTMEKFNEALFAEVMELALGMPLCALGMTKEIDAPVGAIRVYVDDKTWQDHVLELMNKAEKIFILINTRKSCIWEIEKSKSMLDKTIFIVDDIDRYSNVKKYIDEGIIMPDISDNQSLPFYFKNKGKAEYLGDEFDGYLHLLGLNPTEAKEEIASRKKARKHTDAKKNTIVTIVVVILLIALFLSGILSLLSLNH